MHFILDRIEQAIVKLGGTLNDVVRTRIYVNDINDWEIVAKIHGDKFRKIRPVNTLIQAKLAGECLVEVEAEVKYPAISDAACSLTEKNILTAFIVLKEKFGKEIVESIINFAKLHLATYKVPKKIICVNEIPRNINGKIIRKKLSEL